MLLEEGKRPSQASSRLIRWLVPIHRNSIVLNWFGPLSSYKNNLKGVRRFTVSTVQPLNHEETREIINVIGKNSVVSLSGDNHAKWFTLIWSSLISSLSSFWTAYVPRVRRNCGCLLRREHPWSCYANYLLYLHARTLLTVSPIPQCQAYEVVRRMFHFRGSHPVSISEPGSSHVADGKLF